MQKVNLNLIPGGVRPVVNVSQFDEGRQFQLAIYEGNTAYDLAGKTVTIEVGKLDGNGCAYGSTDEVKGTPVVAVSGNIVTITTPVQMTAVAGENAAELKISTSSADVRTLNFILNCERAALSPDTPLSDTEIPAIERAGWDAVEHYPYIDISTNHWMVWDVDQGEYVDTGIGAGGGGVTDYNDLTSRPQINSVLLTGNKTAADLGLATDDVMTGATSGTAGAKGLVPAPAIGDEEKYLRGDGTWQTNTGVSTLAGLTDTDIETPTDGQVLKYDGANSKWVNGAGGTGATTLASLTDTDINTPTDAQPLTYDNANSKWINGGIIPTANGGTGNADGYIRTGLKTGTAAGTGSTVEGRRNAVLDSYSHAEGDDNTLYGSYSHVEGTGNSLNGAGSHVEGYYNTVTGSCVHVEGHSNSVSASYTHASGYGNTANYNYQTAIGKYNKNAADSLFEIGNGTSTALADRSNAIAVKSDGRIIKGASDAFPAASNLAPVEMTRTMTAQRTAGSFVFVAEDDVFYKVTTTIAASGTLTPGTNATAMTVADVLGQLNSDKVDKQYVYNAYTVARGTIQKSVSAGGDTNFSISEVTVTAPSGYTVFAALPEGVRPTTTWSALPIMYFYNNKWYIHNAGSQADTVEATFIFFYKKNAT